MTFLAAVDVVSFQIAASTANRHHHHYHYHHDDHQNRADRTDGNDYEDPEREGDGGWLWGRGRRREQ